MLKSILVKTLYEKRWSTFGWWLAMVVFTLMVVSLFPTFQESFGQTLKDVPESMRAFLGQAEDYQQLAGYLDLQVFAQMVFLTVILGAIMGSGLIAGEENSGTLQSLLAQPVSRSRVYFEKLLASIFILGIVTSGMFVAILLGAASISESVNLWRLVQSCTVFWLVSCVIGLMAYALGAMTGRRGVAGSVAGIYAFTAFMITSLSQTVEGLKTVNYFSVFNYFNRPSVIKFGVQWNDAAVLLAVAILLTTAGYLVFRRRDIYSR